MAILRGRASAITNKEKESFPHCIVILYVYISMWFPSLSYAMLNFSVDFLVYVLPIICAVPSLTFSLDELHSLPARKFFSVRL